VLDATPAESKSADRMGLLYAFFDPRIQDAMTTAEDALDAFVPAVAQTVQKSCGATTVTHTDLDSETVWRVLESSERLRTDNGCVEGSMIFQISSPA
jgi:hypothetical protein